MTPKKAEKLIKIVLVIPSGEFPFIGTNVLGTQLKHFYSLLFAIRESSQPEQLYCFLFLFQDLEELYANLKPYFLPTYTTYLSLLCVSLFFSCSD